MAAEEHNQAEAIAVNLMELSGLTVPIIAVVTGKVAQVVPWRLVWRTES